jgi:hypothetical protein
MEAQMNRSTWVVVVAVAEQAAAVVEDKGAMEVEEVAVREQAEMVGALFPWTPPIRLPWTIAGISLRKVQWVEMDFPGSKALWVHPARVAWAATGAATTVAIMVDWLVLEPVGDWDVRTRIQEVPVREAVVVQEVASYLRLPT